MRAVTCFAVVCYPSLFWKAGRGSGLTPREPSEGYDNIGVSEDELTVEVGKAQEGLDVFDVSRFWPV